MFWGGGIIVKTPGAIANGSGNVAEKHVLSVFSDYGYHILTDIEHKTVVLKIKTGLDPVNVLASFSQPVVTRRLRGYANIYNVPHYHDFLVWSKKFPNGLILENKWQTVGGSVDEKFPFVVATLKNIPLATTGIIIDGGGYRECAVTWLRKQATNQFLVFVGIGEFYRWVRLNLT